MKIKEFVPIGQEIEYQKSVYHPLVTNTVRKNTHRVLTAAASQVITQTNKKKEGAINCKQKTYRGPMSCTNIDQKNLQSKNRILHNGLLWIG